MRHAIEIAGQAFNHREVASGTERLAGTGHYGHVGLPVARNVRPDPGKLTMHDFVGGVVLIRAVQGDQKDAIGTALKCQLLVTCVLHVVFLR